MLLTKDRSFYKNLIALAIPIAIAMKKKVDHAEHQLLVEAEGNIVH